MKKVIVITIMIALFASFASTTKVEAKTKYVKVKTTTIKVYKKALKENKKLKKENKALIQNFLDFGFWEFKGYFYPEANFCKHCSEHFPNRLKGEIYNFCPNCGHKFE